MGVHYCRKAGKTTINYLCQEGTVRSGFPVCQRVPGNVVDRAVSDLLLELVQPLTLEVALAVEKEVQARCAETDALRHQQVERARYEAEVARRRYMSVDPENRLVASSLEAEWNEKLRAHAAAQEDYEKQTEQQHRMSEEEVRQKVLSLATDFPRIWNDPELEALERKRMLRLLIEDITLIKADTITAHVRLRGGATRTLKIDRPLPMAEVRKTKPEVVAEIDRLLDHHCDDEIAQILNREGRRTCENEPFNIKKIGYIRRAYNLKSRYSRMRTKGLLTAKEMSVQHAVAIATIHFWARTGRLQKHRYENPRRCLFAPLEKGVILKGRGGRQAVQPTFKIV